jgi:alpha-mannosidase
MSEDKGQVTAEAWPFVTAESTAPRQAIGLQWSGPAALAPRVASIDGVDQEPCWSRASPHRSAWAPVYVPLAGAARLVTITIPGSEQPELSVLVEPPLSWELFLVPHSHVDIGYTEHQDILSDAHGDYIAQALDIMNSTDCRPDEERYRWTCEASWTVEQFLRRHPDREDEFVRRLRQGRMELTALYVNMTDLFGPEMIERSVLDAVRLRDRYNVPLTSACNYDVNGFGWSLAGVLARAGVRYLDTAINETRSRGVRPRPTLFRWADPNGAEVLLWHSSGYLAGSDLGLHSPTGESAPLVAAHLNKLRRGGYPHSGVQLLISGQQGDSMPPTAGVCDVIAAWNRTWRTPRLRLATVREWFEHLERCWPQEAVRYQRAWPDWWADGNGSALYESALVRETQARLAGLDAQRDVAAEAGIDLSRLDATYDTAWRRAMIFCEHTWGPYESGIDPDSPASRGQWHSKAGNAYAAAALADSIELEQMTAVATDDKVSAHVRPH